jgi:putative ABC transport system substrate-binding protein
MHSGSPTDDYHLANIDTFISSVKASYGQLPDIIGPIWAYNDSKKLKDLAAALLKDNVNLIVAAGGSRSALAAIQTTKKRAATPVVFTSASHSVAHQISLPSNATGVCAHTSDLDVDRLQLLHDAKPNATDVGVLVNSNRSDYKKKQKADLEALAKTLKLKLRYADVNGPLTPKKAFKDWQGKIEVALVAADPFFNDTREEIVDLAGNIPTIFQWREFVELGGLMSYGLSMKKAYTEAGKIAADILTTPNTIPPVWEPQQNDFELVFNKTTIEKLRLSVPKSLLGKAQIIS